MKHLSIAIGCAAVFFLTGCSDGGSKGKKVSTRGTRGTPTTQSDPGRGPDIPNHEDYLPQGEELAGEIFERAEFLPNFQRGVDDMLSSFMDPSYVDYERNEFGLFNAETGISFGALIEFADIDFRPGVALNSRVRVRTNTAKLRVSVFDELVGTEYINDEGEYRIYTEIPMDFSELSEYQIFNNDQMLFVFEDAYGYVAFTSEAYGGFSNVNGQSIYSGAFYYRNKTHYRYDDDVDENWTALGFFSVPTCSFFKCS